MAALVSLLESGLYSKLDNAWKLHIASENMNFFTPSTCYMYLKRFYGRTRFSALIYSYLRRGYCMPEATLTCPRFGGSGFVRFWTNHLTVRVSKQKHRACYREPGTAGQLSKSDTKWGLESRKETGRWGRGWVRPEHCTQKCVQRSWGRTKDWCGSSRAF